MGGVHDLRALTETDRGRVGGKAATLGALVRAGLPVPPGFCVEDDVAADAGVVLEAYRALGGGPVAVRSSAVGEDEADASFAGVFRTRLDIADEGGLVEAIADVRRSAAAGHVTAHAAGPVRMAVIVQRRVAADAAGVAFTRDPSDPDGQHLAVAAAWGFGTGVVGGGPADRFRVDRTTGAVVAQTVAAKPTRATPDWHEPVAADRVNVACLTHAQLRRLSKLALAAEAVVGSACDVEWALAGERLWLLQARPAAASGAAEREEYRRREIARLEALAEPAGTVWARHQLAESAPHPTPMTWGVLQSLLSVRGGYGRMLRRLGFDPDPAVDAAGFVQLVAGRPYLNLNADARLDFRGLPYAIDFAVLKREPQRALRPQRDLRLDRLTSRFWLRLPLTVWRALRQGWRLKRQRGRYSGELRERAFPAFAEAVRRARQEEMAALSSAALLDRFSEWRRRTLEEFAEFALQPAVFASDALGRLLAAVPPGERPAFQAQLPALLTSTPGEPPSDLPAALGAVLRGQLDRAAFLARFGHRGPEEFELARPRWAEAPPDLDTPANAAFASLLRPELPARLEPLVRAYRDAVALRELGRHHLMLGYAYLRELLLELDRRHALGGGVFFLDPEELPRLIAGDDLRGLLRARRREHALARGLPVPTVLFSDDLDAIGRSEIPSEASVLTGTPIAPGTAEGAALVVAEPHRAPPHRPAGFVLVCPAVDAAWLPLLAGAAAVVMETGTDLSHGAILLRELGLPAAAGFPGILGTIASGARVRVEGHRGTVVRLDHTRPAG